MSFWKKKKELYYRWLDLKDNSQGVHIFKVNKDNSEEHTHNSAKDLFEKKAKENKTQIIYSYISKTIAGQFERTIDYR